MNDLKRDMMRIQELIGNAFRQTGSLVALTDGGQMNPNKLQKTLEQTMEQFEAATLELRKLCERYAPGSGGFAKKPILPSMDVTGSVEAFGYGWLHITINTLLPHCRYQSPNWLSDTIRRLLDSYEACGKELPFFERAMLIIDEHTAMEGRHIFDQDNKGFDHPERSGFVPYLNWFAGDDRTAVCRLVENHRGWISQHADELTFRAAMNLVEDQ